MESQPDTDIDNGTKKYLVMTMQKQSVVYVHRQRTAHINFASYNDY